MSLKYEPSSAGHDGWLDEAGAQAVAHPAPQPAQAARRRRVSTRAAAPASRPFGQVMATAAPRAHSGTGGKTAPQEINPQDAAEKHPNEAPPRNSTLWVGGG